MKIYIKEKDLNGATSCQFNGECYSLTGFGKTKSQVTATDISQVTTHAPVEMGIRRYTGGSPPLLLKFNVYPDQNATDLAPVTFLDPTGMAWLRANPSSNSLIFNAENPYNSTNVDSPTDWDKIVDGSSAIHFRTTYGREGSFEYNYTPQGAGEYAWYYTSTLADWAADENIAAVGVKTKNFTL